MLPYNDVFMVEALRQLKYHQVVVSALLFIRYLRIECVYILYSIFIRIKCRTVGKEKTQIKCTSLETDSKNIENYGIVYNKLHAWW